MYILLFRMIHLQSSVDSYKKSYLLYQNIESIIVSYPKLNTMDCDSLIVLNRFSEIKQKLQNGESYFGNLNQTDNNTFTFCKSLLFDTSNNIVGIICIEMDSSKFANELFLEHVHYYSHQLFFVNNKAIFYQPEVKSIFFGASITDSLEDTLFVDLQTKNKDVSMITFLCRNNRGRVIYSL